MEYDSESAKKKLAPIFAKLIESVLSACELKNKALIPEARAQAKQRDDSGLMNSFVTHNLRRLLTGITGINFRDRYGQLQILVGSDYRIKAKQRGRWRLVDFHETQLAMDFLHQVSEFPGMPSPIANLILTHKLDATRTSIEKISLVCPKTDTTAYFEIDLLEQMQQTLPFTSAESASEPPTIKPITPKEKKKRNIKPRQNTRKRKRKNGPETN